jgi:CRP-like cAMP-binding protein/small-conductance mechanosensitive channel
VEPILLALGLQAGPPIEFWGHLRFAAQQDELIKVTVIFLLSAAMVALLARDQRAYIRTALEMFIGALFLILMASVAAVAGLPTASKIIHSAALLFGGFAMGKLASVLIFDVILKRTHLSPPRIARDLLAALGYVAVGLWLVSRSGVTLSSIVATSAVVTGLVVFSLQDSLSNILGGLVLQMDETLSEGDWVKIDQTGGRVKDIGWRTISIETRNWDTVIIPNSVLMKSQILVQGRRAGQPIQERRWIYFNVDFRIPPTEVIRMVTEALVADPLEGVAAEPKPNCLLMEFKESYASYAVRYWLTDLARDDPTDSLVRGHIYFALQRAGIALPVPAYTTFVEARDVERQRLHHEREIQHRMTALDLARVELFQTMNEEERRKVAEQLRYTPFMKGEVMTRQGAQAHWLYILTKGLAEVVLSADSGVTKRVSVLNAGDFFGEMSLLTGEPRSATVRALEDSECYRLDRQAFEDILRARPELTQHFSEVLARREVELEAVRHDLDAAARATMMQHHQRSIFADIYKLFGLSHSPERQESKG